MVIAETYANLGWIAMMSLNPTPFWDHLGCPRGEGGVPQDRVIGTSGDPVIGKPKSAPRRRGEKPEIGEGKPKPRKHEDTESNLEIGKRKPLNPTPNSAHPRENHARTGARLGCGGIPGEGGREAGIPGDRDKGLLSGP
jgi:hypothetical protein